MLGLLGGTGPEGKGLGLRFALAGERVMIGSRQRHRAKAAAEELGCGAIGGLNSEVAAKSDPVFVTTPYQGQAETLEPLSDILSDKIVVVTVAPLKFDPSTVSAIHIDAGSAAEEVQQILPNAKVVAAFQTISAIELLNPHVRIESDVVVCSDHLDAKKSIMTLAEKIDSIRAVDAGSLVNAHYVAQIIALLLNINREYKTHSSIKITGI